MYRLYRQALESDDLQAWEEFVRAVQPVVASAVYFTLARWGKPATDRVDDLAQDAFAKLCEGHYSLLRAFRGESPKALTAYIRIVAARVASDAQRLRAAEKRGSAADPLELDEARHVPAVEESAEAVERRMFLASVEECLSAQEDRDRDVFWLYYRQGFTTKAISELAAVGLTSKGVQSLIHRLTSAVRKCLNVPSRREIRSVLKGKDG